MTTYQIRSAADATQYVAAHDLRAEALDALDRDEDIEVVRCRHPASGVAVETLIIKARGGASGDIGRAGQSIGGSKSDWGDYIEDDHGGYLVHDESGEIFLLDGSLSEEVA